MERQVVKVDEINDGTAILELDCGHYYVTEWADDVDPESVTGTITTCYQCLC